MCTMLPNNWLNVCKLQFPGITHIKFRQNFHIFLFAIYMAMARYSLHIMYDNTNAPILIVYEIKIEKHNTLHHFQTAILASLVLRLYLILQYICGTVKPV